MVLTMTNIQWENLPDAPATEEMIASVEDALGFHYPTDFRALAPSIHGASPTPSTFSVMHPRIGRFGGFIAYVLSFDPKSSEYIMPTVEAHRREGILPSGVVPFGEDGGGDLMAFDFRKNADNPPVVYIAISDAEEAGERHILPLASSFSAFLSMLGTDDPNIPRISNGNRKD
jgi:hypothetical protein